MSGIHIEALVASGYALFLVAVAACLERLGRHTHQRSSIKLLGLLIVST